MSNDRNRYDIVIAGSGFAGSLTALILRELGFKICLLEKSRHPRFAIGESSTPIADMILRDLSAKYHLPWLYPFSRYGSWQQSHPEIICGIKRGFSFFKHHPGKEFVTNEDHQHELLVAANADDMLSDTNWLRADMDAFLVSRVVEAGIDYFDQTEIIKGDWNSYWDIQLICHQKPAQLQASFFIDATGSGALLHHLLGIKSSAEDFLTNSFALFSHFRNVPCWMDMLQQTHIPTDDFPYNPDRSALHHILDEGWLWVLRFNDERTSMGFVLQHEEVYSTLSTERIWNDLLSKYPAIHRIMQPATLADPPGKILRSSRLQRKAAKCVGRGWAALPHTAGFVDPLYSTGIAFSLSGIERIVEIIRNHWGHDKSLNQKLKDYEHAVFEELTLLDHLITGSYKTMSHFELFNVWSMLYFAVTIAYEQDRLRGKPAESFLHAGRRDVMQMVQTSYAELLKITEGGEPSRKSITEFSRIIRERIHPINSAGLLDPASKNMYRHTAAELPNE